MSELYKTAKGKVIDMNRLANQHELTVAVSNIKINARGDELGPGGQIIRKQTDDSSYVGVPVEENTYRPVAQPVAQPVSAPMPAVKVVDSPNALVQPVIKEEKPAKGK